MELSGIERASIGDNMDRIVRHFSVVIDGPGTGADGTEVFQRLLEKILAPHLTIRVSLVSLERKPPLKEKKK